MAQNNIMPGRIAKAAAFDEKGTGFDNRSSSIDQTGQKSAKHAEVTVY